MKIKKALKTKMTKSILDFSEKKMFTNEKQLKIEGGGSWMFFPPGRQQKNSRSF